MAASPGLRTLRGYLVFDVLELEGGSAAEGAGADTGIVRRLSRNGLKARKEAGARGFEGLVAKDPQSPYVGGRTLKWLNVKQPRYREGERG
jgi:hypothetical protein